MFKTAILYKIKEHIIFNLLFTTFISAFKCLISVSFLFAKIQICLFYWRFIVSLHNIICRIKLSAALLSGYIVFILLPSKKKTLNLHQCVLQMVFVFKVIVVKYYLGYNVDSVSLFNFTFIFSLCYLVTMTLALLLR